MFLAISVTLIFPLIPYRTVNWQSSIFLAFVFFVYRILLVTEFSVKYSYYTTHIRLSAIFPGLPSTRKVKPIWILLKREIVSGSVSERFLNSTSAHYWLLTAIRLEVTDSKRQ